MPLGEKIGKKEKIIRNLMYILLFILFSSVTYSQDHNNCHCYCGSQHKNYFYYSPEINYNIGKNWANGVVISYWLSNSYPYNTYLELDIKSTRIGSSIFSKKINQDFFTIGIKRRIFEFDYFDLKTTFKIGYLNSENVNITSTNNNLILTPEININFFHLDLNVG